jgi:hypothetical protein
MSNDFALGLSLGMMATSIVWMLVINVHNYILAMHEDEEEESNNEEEN